MFDQERRRSGLASPRGDIDSGFAFERVQRAPYGDGGLGERAQGVDQGVTQFEIVRADEDAGVAHVVALDQLAEQFSNQGEIAGDTAFGGDGGPHVAKVGRQLGVALQSRALANELRKQAFGFRYAQRAQVDFGRLDVRQERGTLNRRQMILAMPGDCVFRNVEADSERTGGYSMN